MATVEATKDNFEGLIKKGGIVLVDFWAEWCGPCRGFAPVFEKASNTHADVTFAKVDTEDQPELARAFEIRAIPTLMIFRDEILIFSQAGALPADALEEVLEKTRALDMADVKKAIAEEEGKAEAKAKAKG